MDIKITPRKLSGEIAAIDSKSHAHRLLIALAMACLCDAPSSEILSSVDGTGTKEVKDLRSPGAIFSAAARAMISDMSEDLSATIDCLEALLTYEEPHLYCGESGSTLRFLLPLSLVAGRGAAFFGKGKLPQRPLVPLDIELARHGAIIDKETAHLQPNIFSKETADQNGLSESRHGQQFICHASVPEGRTLSGGDYEMPGHISSQYITGLLMALPLCCEDSRVMVTSKLQSRSYIDITLAVLRDFGIEITVKEDSPGLPDYYIKGGQRYVIPRMISDGKESLSSMPTENIRPEGDWSNAAFWLAAAALGSDIHVSGLNDASPQGDRAIAEILETFKSRTNALIQIDAGNIPDLVPIISVMAALSPGQTRIFNAGRLRIKESDRLKTTHAMLSALGADIHETDDGLIINGRDVLDGGTVDGAGDHRIVMAAAIAATCCTGSVTIRGAEAASKSYPAFFDHYKLLGGSFSKV